MYYSCYFSHSYASQALEILSDASSWECTIIIQKHFIYFLWRCLSWHSWTQALYVRSLWQWSISGSGSVKLMILSALDSPLQTLFYLKHCNWKTMMENGYTLPPPYYRRSQGCNFWSSIEGVFTGSNPPHTHTIYAYGRSWGLWWGERPVLCWSCLWLNISVPAQVLWALNSNPVRPCYIWIKRFAYYRQMIRRTPWVLTSTTVVAD